MLDAFFFLVLFYEVLGRSFREEDDTETFPQQRSKV